MNPIGQVPMLDLTGLSSSYSGESSMDVPQPMEGLQGLSPAPFLTKTCELVDDPNTNHIVSWSRGNNSFVVWDPEAFSAQVLPYYFKHGNLSSFIRQLNTYGFRKVDPDKLEFASEWFLRGQRHLLKNIKRRKPPSQVQESHQVFDSSCVEVGQFGPETEIERLRRDKQVLMVELVRLRQEQQNTKAHLKTIENRLKGTEMKQKHVVSFLARMIQNPGILEQLVQQDSRKKLEEVIISKKRRRAIDQGLNYSVEVVELGQGEGRYDAKSETVNFGVITVPELNTHYMDMQAPSGTSSENEERQKGQKSLDEGFWEELLNDRNEEPTGLFGTDAGEDNRDMFDDQIDEDQSILDGFHC